jgi:hypothetical protein
MDATTILALVVGCTLFVATLAAWRLSMPDARGTVLVPITSRREDPRSRRRPDH